MDGGNWDLPGTLREVAEVIGRERAMYLAGQVLHWDRQGQRGKAGWVYIPKKLEPHHRLNELVTLDEALKLVEVFGGENLTISMPAGPVRRFRNMQIQHLASEGLRPEVIAYAVGITPRQVRNVLGATVGLA